MRIDPASVRTRKILYFLRKCHRILVDCKISAYKLDSFPRHALTPYQSIVDREAKEIPQCNINDGGLETDRI